MTEVFYQRIPWEPGQEGGPLGRHIRHDPQSRNFAIQPMGLGGLATMRHKSSTRILNQGDIGACVPHAGAKVLSTKPFGHRFHEATALDWYDPLTKMDPFPGHWPPVDTGSDGLSMAKYLKDLGLISRYEHAFSLEAALTGLQHGAIMVGIWWREGCDRPNAHGEVRWDGAYRGGHEFVFDEIDVERRLVGGPNSWGPDWGLKGRFYMGWDDFGAALANQGDCTRLIP